MTKLNRLKKEALTACIFRGHKMSKFYALVENETAYAACMTCHKVVCVHTKSAANDINISGKAVALHCEG